MIDKPDNGHNPELRDQEGALTRSSQTATVMVEPDTRATQSSASNPDPDPQTPTPVTEPAPTAQAGANRSGAAEEPLSAATEPVRDVAFSSDLTKFRQSFEEIQAEFIGAPRDAVEKAEVLIDGLMNSLRDQLQRIHSDVKTDADTEQLRVAMLSYRDLFRSLGGHRVA